MRKILHLPRAPGRDQELTKHDGANDARTSNEPIIDSKDVKPDRGFEPPPWAPSW